jgi:selenophosphate synthetase-related protein
MLNLICYSLQPIFGVNLILNTFWDAATTAEPAQLRGDLALLPQLAETGLCDAGKDISMGELLAPF